MATATKTNQTTKRNKSVPIPADLTVSRDQGFRPVSARATENPFLPILLDATVGEWLIMPEADEATTKAMVGRMRAAAQHLGVGTKVRQDSEGRTGFAVTGPAVKRPRKAKANGSA